MRFYKVGGAGEEQCSWRRDRVGHEQGVGGGWGRQDLPGGSEHRASTGRAQGEHRASTGRAWPASPASGAWPASPASGAWPASPASGTWPASPADRLGIRQSLPVRAFIAGRDCRLVSVKREHARSNAGFRVGFRWHGDCIRLWAASLAVVLNGV